MNAFMSGKISAYMEIINILENEEVSQEELKLALKELVEFWKSNPIEPLPESIASKQLSKIDNDIEFAQYLESLKNKA